MSPVKSWLKSLPIVIGSPVLGWIFLSVLFGIWEYPKTPALSRTIYFLIPGLYGVVIHSVLYLFLGLPIFFSAHRFSDFRMWDLLLLLSFTSTIVLIGYSIFIYSSSQYADLSMTVIIALVFSLYGSWSSLCARRYKLNLENKTLHPTADQL